ncbi:uncharacterized protein ASPGLDRAFT_48203 [Aspergillus glaucus CBS 516.65]|uniref:Nephrocystin 3-like N-terminal domain-containing protein n=1 Tax=Aspergillus glaucus CBS 516.65 TaxID=1160497 RepID=A0A1L9VIA0_ASPGL|nr:hypothetical protein ASPGLDRAFT_48203 [Aspergillus glaucus CBS 516.65]OJJ83651.1 hypothetical protein ASPGLDRAFT_48203 [Aspergillus glaucus CBS 516.65]
MLGASFFFNRNEGDRSNSQKFFSAITVQLMAHFREKAGAVRLALEHESWITSKAFGPQFRDLVYQPLTNVRWQRPIVLVVDALDEYESTDDEDIRSMLNMLPTLKQIDSVKVTIFIISRPELPIRQEIHKIPIEDHDRLVLQNLSSALVKHDLTVFFRFGFQKILAEREGDISSEGWPGEETIYILTEKAYPLFIFASTICRFVADETEDPEERLAGIMEYYQTTGHASQLDQTYRPDLNYLLAGKSEKDFLMLLKRSESVPFPLSLSTRMVQSAKRCLVLIFRPSRRWLTGIAEYGD